MSTSKPTLRPVSPLPPSHPGPTEQVPTGTWSGVRAPLQDPHQVQSQRTEAAVQDAKQLAHAPLLASSVLWEDFAPQEPGKEWLRQAAMAVGILGTAATLILSWQEPIALILAALFMLIGLLGIIGMSYGLRATSILPLALCGLLSVSWLRTGVIGLESGPWLAVGISVLSASLLFRAFYRSSKTSRILVGASITVCMGWLVVAIPLHEFVVLDLHWQSWIKPMMWLSLALLLLLSMLAFMEARTTGGCKLWAMALLGWYAAYLTVEWALNAWPAPEGMVLSEPLRHFARSTPPFDGQLTAELLTLSTILLSLITALSLWQLLSSVYTAAFHKRQNDVSVKLLADKGLR